MISPDANSPTEKNKDDWCDIIIVAIENRKLTKRFAIELVAHARDGPANRRGTVEEHNSRAEKSYMKMNGVEQVWVVNFCTRPFMDKNTYVWPNEKSGVKAIHICHDLNWTTATVVVDTNKKQPITVQLFNNK